MMHRHDTAESKSRRAGEGLLVLLVAAALGAFFLWIVAGDRQTQFQDLALGEETTSVYASVDGRRIHCANPKNADACIDGIRRRALPSRVLWLGNSQLHGVNKAMSGDRNAVAVLFDTIASNHAIDAVAFSQPNANLQEHYVLFEYLNQRIHFDILVLALVFDDTRETGIRSEFANSLADPAVARGLGMSAIGRQLLANHSDKLATGNDDDVAGLKGTLQERSELYLNDLLAERWSFWRRRSQARGAIYNGLYKTRNTVFGISPQSKRRLIPGYYAQNLAALDAILARATASDIRVIAYIAPIRQDIESPYVASEYRAFKREAELRIKRHGQVFADLETLVPGEFWGFTGASLLGGKKGPDFMHFQAAGHRLLGRAVADLVLDAVPGDGE